MAKKKKRIVLAESSSEGLGSLGDVLKQAGFRESENEQAEPAQAADIPDGGQQGLLSHTEKIVVRKERKGRGGKTVTIVERLERSQAEMKQLVKQLQKALGCGATIEDGRMVLQGDQVDRVKQWFVDEAALSNTTAE